MHKIIGLGLVTALTALAGCAAPTAEASPGDEATGSDDVVGITDLQTLERNFGLKLATAQNRGSDEALKSGACYGALIANGTGYPEFEFRRYVNGAAFWAKKGSGFNSGDERPVLCLDLHGPDHGVSLSGVALDAAIRYDLGKFKGSDAGMQKVHYEFERGAIHFSNYDVTDRERAESVQRRPHEQPFEHASTIAGRLSSITINGVTADIMFDGVSTRDVEINADTAYFVYRYAWRKSEDTGRFTIAGDAVGSFSKNVRMVGDGPGYAETWSFARGEIVYSKFGDYSDENAGRTIEEISFRAANAPEGTVPAAECSRTTPDPTGENEPPMAPPSFGCTGI